MADESITTSPPAQEPAVEPQAEKAQPPSWPALSPEHPLTTFQAALPALLTSAAYSEVYGITLSPTGSFHTTLILQKFLRANANDVSKAKDQLLATLKWRKEYQPLQAKDEVFSKARFGGLGYVIQIEGVPGDEQRRQVVTFNIYGAVKDNKATFEDLDGFLRWRIALMELSIAHLSLPTATIPIPDYGQGPDPHQGIQVHDYLSVSFLRMDPYAKAASKKTIDTLQRYYPETLSRKFFVNVPVVMGWMFSAMKLVLARETVRKFTVLSYGEGLVAELGKGVPRVYGGEGEELEKGETVGLE